jgi:hypothetical protein
MKRTIIILAILLLASVATAQFPQELQGDRVNIPGTVKIQGDLDMARTPWGDIWREDPEIIYFGELSTPHPDLVMLNWQFVAHWCGEAFWNAGPALEWLTLVWNEDLQCYTKIFSETDDRITLHTFTLEEERGVWRSGILVWDGDVWEFDPTNYRETIVVPQKIYMFNHAVIDQEPPATRRVSARRKP